jgi:hypothetical protein
VRYVARRDRRGVGTALCWAGAAILLALGLLGWGAGLRLVFLVPRDIERHIAATERAPELDAAALATAPVGEHVLVAGRIAAGNPSRAVPRPGGEVSRYVIYDLSHVDPATPGPNGVQYINEVHEATVTPPFALDAPDGAVAVLNGDYAAVYPLNHVGGTPDGKRITGFIVGDEAVVDGTVVRGPDGPALRAGLVHYGTRDTYVAAVESDRRGLGFYQLAGWLLVLAGAPGVLCGLALAAFALWRRRHPRPARPADA